MDGERELSGNMSGVGEVSRDRLLSTILVGNVVSQHVFAKASNHQDET